MNVKKIIRSGKGKARQLLRAVKTSFCYRYYYKYPLRDDLIFIESRNGREPAGNMLRLLLEIRRLYGGRYTVAFGAMKESVPAVRATLEKYGISGVKILTYESVPYYHYLETARYLINDTTFPDRFIKRKGQIYLNTWHGTPLKCMGKDSEGNVHLMHNVQRNLFMSDFLVCPSDYCRDILVGAYCLDDLYEGTVLKEGYPRNTVFFDEESRARVRENSGLNGKRVYVYMPTFREAKSVHQDAEQKKAIKGYFDTLDAMLRDDEIFFVKLHYYVAQDMDLSVYRHIRDFPKGIETYEFLNAADALVTDYSSVMYDFANAPARVIRFVYDEDEYFNNRGFYDQPAEFPFAKVRTAEELAEELHREETASYEEFRRVYCTYDKINASENIIRRVFEGIVCSGEQKLRSEKECVVIYGGALDKNGITTSLVNLVNLIDDGRKYYVSFSRKSVGRKIQNMETVPSLGPVYEVSGYPQPTFLEAAAVWLFYSRNRDSAFTNKYLDRLYGRENFRCFGWVDFTNFIQFVGYERVMISMYQRIGKPNAIFVHNDMVQELATKKNQHALTLKKAYGSYDKVAVVSDFLIDKTASISGRRDNIVVVENTQDDRGILERSTHEIEIQGSTKVVFGPEKDQAVEQLRREKEAEEADIVLPAPSDEELAVRARQIGAFLDRFRCRFATIGRYSKEKGHERLIRAFELVHAEHPDTGLVIIGGYGDLFEATVRLAGDSPAKDAILLIAGVKNPLPILKRCDLFLLTSDYEGVPMVFHEANCLGLPVVSTEAGGATSFMKKYGGTLTEKDPAAIAEQMVRFLEEGIPKLNIEYETYNRNCLGQFESLIH